MKRQRKPAYALIYLLAALPLIAVVGNMTVVITGRALRAQRLAVAERADDGTRSLILDQLRRDAQSAVTAEGDPAAFGGAAVLRSGEWVVEYQCTGPELTRIEKNAGAVVSRTTWTFEHGTCALRLEKLPNNRALIWLRCAVTLPELHRLAVSRQYTTAVAVGQGDLP